MTWRACEMGTMELGLSKRVPTPNFAMIHPPKSVYLIVKIKIFVHGEVKIKQHIFCLQHKKETW